MQSISELFSSLDIRGHGSRDLEKDFSIKTSEDLETWFKEEGHTWEMLISKTRLFRGGAELLSNALIEGGYEVSRYTMPAQFSGVLVPTEKEGQVRLAYLRNQVYMFLRSHLGQAFSKDNITEELGRRRRGPVTGALNFLLKMEVKGIRCDESKTLFWMEGETPTAEAKEELIPLKSFTDSEALELAKQAQQHLEKAREMAKEIKSLEEEQRKQKALASIMLESANHHQRLAEQLAELGE